MSHPTDRSMLAALPASDSLARQHGAGGLSPALAAAFAADLRFSPRVSLPVQDRGAGDADDGKIIRLDDVRPGAPAGRRAGGVHP